MKYYLDRCGSHHSSASSRRKKQKKRRHTQRLAQEVNNYINDSNKEENDNNSKLDHLVRGSAFRAVGNANQIVHANTSLKVLFQDEQFDLENEYNLATSTFIPETNGVYFISAAIGFSPNNNNINYRIRIEIRVNGKPSIVIEKDFWGAGLLFNNREEVSSIIELHAGDQVEVFVESDIDGIVEFNKNGSNSAHFEAARFPSPKI